ncbi:hypothetical protein GGQ65_001954 [Rhizobium fabae]|uniref:Uncharacterized protein n=1 Tax=Rhizobium fabae TaxID=573179 RepID=A0A7W6B9H6_9HYPH|nr:hypothetical protein [Rhizobium fabae]
MTHFPLPNDVACMHLEDWWVSIAGHYRDVK